MAVETQSAFSRWKAFWVAITWRDRTEPGVCSVPEGEALGLEPEPWRPVVPIVEHKRRRK